MTDPSRKSSAKPPMPEKISLRRGQKVLLNYSTRSLFQAIKKRKLLATDEYSLDGRHWVKLGSHKQLEKYFDKTPSSVEPHLEKAIETPAVDSKEAIEENISIQPGSPPPGLDDDLQKLADLLKGINSGP